MITIAQCRAARGFLNWTQQDLADAAGLSKTAINNYEKGHSDIKAESLKAIENAFESLNIAFIGRQGITVKTQSLKVLEGNSLWEHLIQDIHLSLKGIGGEILLNLNGATSAFQLSEKTAKDYQQAFRDNGISERALIPKNTPYAGFCLQKKLKYRDSNLNDHAPSTIIYGSKVAFLLWQWETCLLIFCEKASMAERERFELLWYNT